MSYLTDLGKKAKSAAEKLIRLDGKTIDDTLRLVATLLKENKEYLKTENAKDVENAKRNGKNAAFLDRLALTDKVIDGVADGVLQVAELESPLYKTVYKYENKEQGITVEKKGVPFGVVGMIYEARPNVTADAFALCFKTANAVILKGGSDAINSNIAMVNIIRKALKQTGVDENAVSIIEDTSRETTTAFMKMNDYVDLLIPRGGASLIRSAVENSTIPIIETGTGNCHAYIDESADAEMAANIIFNAKTQRYSVCNALESIVVHKNALAVLPKVAEKLKEKQVEIFADERAFEVLKDYPYISRASEEDFETEYLCAKISIKTVDCLDEAISHVNKNSTHHSETIITKDMDSAQRFMNEVDSSAVYVNASTRFSDGFVFGLGAEIGISTQKLHARGPMGLEALLTQKYFVTGNGAVRK